MKHTIILEQKGNIESHGSLTDICRKYRDLRYATLLRKKYPFTYKGINFKKVVYNQKTGLIIPDAK